MQMYLKIGSVGKVCLAHHKRWRVEIWPQTALSLGREPFEAMEKQRTEGTLSSNLVTLPQIPIRSTSADTFDSDWVT